MILFGGKKKCLGVDIGTAGIKVVELGRKGNRLELLSYGFSENKLASLNGDFKNDSDYLSLAINKICEKSGMTTKTVVASLPAFSVFSSILTLVNVPDKELNEAVQWEAKKIIPLPPEEMILDWKKIKKEEKEKEASVIAGKDKKEESVEVNVAADKPSASKILEGEKDKENKLKEKNTKVLLTGAPRTLVKKYIEIFKKAQLNLASMETETFSLIRSLLGNDKSTIMIVEMGASTTDISIIEKSMPIFSRSIDTGGVAITKAISNNLNIAIERADQFKYDLGVGSLNSQNDVIPKTVIEAIAPIINEIKYSLSLFENKNRARIDKIVLSGGSAMLAHFSNYLAAVINRNVIIGDPWSSIICPEELRPTLLEIGPRLSVAIGSAMRGIE
jgi:type IV pilus assembly protein PilM